MLATSGFLLGPRRALARAYCSGCPKRDAVLSRLLAALPGGWTVSFASKQLRIQRTKPVWCLMHNRLNAAVNLETPARMAATIKKHGRLVRPQIIFPSAPRWSRKRLARARANNDAIYRKIDGLGAKYKVEHLLRRAIRKKGPLIAMGSNPDESKRIEAYQKEKHKLEKGLVRVPLYNTSTLSLFSPRREGFSDELHLVHPEKASQECYKVDVIARRVLSLGR